MANREEPAENRHVQVGVEYTQATGKTTDDVLKELEQTLIAKEILAEDVEDKELEIITLFGQEAPVEDTVLITDETTADIGDEHVEQAP